MLSPMSLGIGMIAPVQLYSEDELLQLGIGITRHDAPERSYSSFPVCPRAD